MFIYGGGEGSGTALPIADGLERTIPVRVRIETEGSELLLGTTFKTGADVGRASP